MVDNNSTDATRDVTESFCADHPDFRYFFEPRQGLSHARNRGWQEARGEYVGYIDDDAKAPEQWLEVAKQIIEQLAPAVFGGPYLAFYNSCRSPWFRDSYGSHTHGTVAKPVAEGMYLSGSNLFFERTLLQERVEAILLAVQGREQECLISECMLHWRWGYLIQLTALAWKELHT